MECDLEKQNPVELIESIHNIRLDERDRLLVNIAYGIGLIHSHAEELQRRVRELMAALISAGASLAIARNGLAEPLNLEHVDKHTKEALDVINAALDGKEA